MNAKEAYQLLNVGMHEAAEFQARVQEWVTLSYSLSRQSKTWDQSPLSDISLTDWKVGVQDATTYDRAEVIMSWENKWKEYLPLKA